MSTPEPPVSDAAVAALGMLRRTGAEWVQIRYSDDEHPVVWFAVAQWPVNRHETAAALDPSRAILRLVEQVVDGGRCVHCDRPTGFEPDHIGVMPLDSHVCWYQYDPELKTIRRGCESSTEGE